MQKKQEGDNASYLNKGTLAMKIFSSFFLLIGCSLSAQMFHQHQITSEWKEENVSPFTELMLSWNATRPDVGNGQFYIRVKIQENWSPWLLYGSWGKDGQRSFSSSSLDGSVRAYQDAVELLEGNQATGFQIRIEPEQFIEMGVIQSLHVYVNNDRKNESVSFDVGQDRINVPIRGLSQMALNHERNRSLCSPTSTTAVVRHLSGKNDLDPIQFAQNVWDQGFDIFGNWVFNVAQASSELGNHWSCWVERLNGFQNIYDRLQKGTPVVVSIRGSWKGSPVPYTNGHLIAVTGYDPMNQKVFCMDPGFNSDEETIVQYDLTDFMEIWNRRGRVAYIFEKNSE